MKVLGWMICVFEVGISSVDKCVIIKFALRCIDRSPTGGVLAKVHSALFRVITLKQFSMKKNDKL